MGKINKEKKDNRITIQMANIIIIFFMFLLLVIFFSWAKNFKLAPELIPINQNGSYLEKTPVNERHKEDDDARQWIVDVIDLTFDFNYVNKEKHTAKLIEFYSPDALSEIDKFINQGNINTKVEANHGIIEMLVSDGIELKSGSIGDRFGWQAKTTGAIMMHHSGKRTRLGLYDITITVSREDESVNIDGFKIINIQMKNKRL